MHNPVNITAVTPDHKGGKQPRDYREDDVVLKESDDQNGCDPNHAGSTSHASQQQDSNKDRRRNEKQTWLIGQKNPGTGGHRFATMKMVKKGKTMAEGSKDPD